MSRFAVLAVVALLVTVGFAPAVAAAPTAAQSASSTQSLSTTTGGVDHADGTLSVGTDADSPENNTTRRLSLEGSVRGNYSTVELDFGGTAGLSAQRVQSQYQVSLVDVQLESAQTQAARTAIVNAYLDAVEAEIDELYAAERQAVRRYHRGEISGQTLLVRLAVVDVRARAIAESMNRIRENAAPISQSTQYRMVPLELELQGFKSEVRRHVAAAASGDLKGGVNPLYVTATNDGVVVEMLDGNQYERNAIRFDNRRPGAPDQFGGDVDAFRERVLDVYSWSYDNLRGQVGFAAQRERALYSMNYRHTQGSLTVYMDGGTAEVFREHQSLFVDRLPRMESEGTTVNNVSVSVTPTPRGGPALVNVTAPGGENTSAVPLDAVVRVNGHTVGRTNDDGVLWFLAPAGEYEVSVVHDGKPVNVTVSP